MQWRFPNSEWCKGQMNLTRKKHRITVTSKENERSDWGFVLNRNCEASWKIPLRLKGSSQCGVSTENNGGLWWLLVAVGDGESSWGIGNGFGRKEEKKWHFSKANWTTRLKMHKWLMPSRNGNVNVAHTPDVFSKIPTVRSWKSVL